jgi:hypothetical protein
MFDQKETNGGTIGPGTASRTVTERRRSWLATAFYQVSILGQTRTSTDNFYYEEGLTSVFHAA